MTAIPTLETNVEIGPTIFGDVEVPNPVCSESVSRRDILGCRFANLVVDHLLLPILLRKERHELDDVGVVVVELIIRPVKAQDEGSRRIILLPEGNNGWH